MTFAERVKELMTDKKASQKDLARSANITEAAVSQYLNSDRVPRMDVVVSFARFFGVSADYLLGLSKEEVASFDQLRLVMTPTTPR